MSFDSITVHDNHEGSTRGDGEWKLAAYVQGKKIDLTEASCTHGTITATLPGGQHITLDQCGVTGLNDAGDGETIKFHPGTEVTVDIPSPLPLSIFVYGEVDCDNPIFPDDVSKKVIAILKGPDTRENMLIEIQNWISFPFDNGIIDEYHHSVCFTGIITGDENTDLGVINKIYEPTGYGAGAHTNEVSTLGGHSGGATEITR